MRMVIDMQGAQTESRFRGIGRYSQCLAQAIVRNRGEHEIILALNALFPETIEPIRAAFDRLLPQENIRLWCAPGPTREADPSNHLRREIAERIREAFLADQQPDVVLITSLFEGFGDDAVSSIGVIDISTPTAVILYDLIPLICPDIQFKASKIHQDWYSRKLESLRRSELLLAISDSAKNEVLKALEFDTHNVISISGACDASFRVLNLSESEKESVCRKIGITKPFVLYTGGADERKNLHRLIEAYANLPASTRRGHQLALVGKMPESNVQDFLQTARKSGLANGEVVITGYVEDDILVRLYNSCTLFVFPSLHEGFGLPPLEAMFCGAPVIAANASSLPEIVGCDEGLFDPQSVTSITNKIKQALTDASFRARLAAHGQSHARKFSWDESAKRALKALSRFDRGVATHQLTSVSIERTSLFSPQHKKILLLKLDHLGDFILAIPAITKLKARYPYAKIDIVVGSWNVPIARELKLFDNIYVLDYFKKASAVAPSIMESEMAALVEKTGNYDIAIDLRRQRDTRFLLAKVNATLKAGYESFDANVDSKLDIKLKAYPDVPFDTTPLNKTNISLQMLRLVDALPDNISDYIFLPDFTQRTRTKQAAVAIFPFAGNDVKEWSKENYISLTDLLVADTRIDVVNVFFGNDRETNKYDFKPNSKLRVYTNLDFTDLVQSLSENVICVANNSFGAHIASYCGCLVIGIYGGHETVSEWAPAFGNNYVIHSAVSCSPCHIADRSACNHKLQCLTNIPVAFVFSKVMESITFVKQRSENTQGAPIREVIEGKNSDHLVAKCVDAIASLGGGTLTDEYRIAIAECIAYNHRPRNTNRQLLVDISELVQRDAKTGIQRVVRSALDELLRNLPSGFAVEPVYATTDTPGYRYARRFTARFLQSPKDWPEDEPVETWPGDVFLGIDLQPLIVPAQQATLQKWRQRGVRVYFVVYDLLPVTMPQVFPEGAQNLHQKWLETITRFDGAIAISRTVAKELRNWLQLFGQPRERPFRISWFHLGGDVENSVHSRGVPNDAVRVLQELARRPTFLTVGTIEPRKGHAQTLAAFDLLWTQDVDANLVIVGKQGWRVEELAAQLRMHPERGNRLFWLEGISDEYLEKLYASSSVLLAASEGEGFGLPLIEAARHKLPILARDIPVFREVAGSYAGYFSAKTPSALAEAIQEWLELWKAGKAPASIGMPWQTWAESTGSLVSLLTDPNHLSWTCIRPTMSGVS